ncbi:unnamed protein product [Amoebophrya sp. A25]|nr:unnamed protein product [Amoebophrya sp. A25]|eukprot:GSA25T00025398001.1
MSQNTSHYTEAAPLLAPALVPASTEEGVERSRDHKAARSCGFVTLRCFPYVTTAYLLFMMILEIQNITQNCAGVPEPGRNANPPRLKLWAYGGENGVPNGRTVHSVLQEEVRPVFCMNNGIWSRSTFLSSLLHTNFKKHYLPNMIILTWTVLLSEMRIAYHLCVLKKYHFLLTPTIWLILLVLAHVVASGLKIADRLHNKYGETIYVFPDLEDLNERVGAATRLEQEARSAVSAGRFSTLYDFYFFNEWTRAIIRSPILVMGGGSSTVLYQYFPVFFSLFFVLPNTRGCCKSCKSSCSGEPRDEDPEAHEGDPFYCTAASFVNNYNTNTSTSRRTTATRGMAREVLLWFLHIFGALLIPLTISVIVVICRKLGAHNLPENVFIHYSAVGVGYAWSILLCSLLWWLLSSKKTEKPKEQGTTDETFFKPSIVYN